MSESSRKRKRKSRFKFFLFEIILIIVLVPLAFLYFMISKIPTHDLDESQIVMNDVNDKNMSNYRNIAIFGVDSRANELDKRTRSDSIIIASINKYTQKVKLVSVYRDTYVYINQKHGYTKINHAYSYGGPELAISALNQNFDLNIKDFVTVNFSALTNVIDALGGVTIDIKEDELDYVNAYTRDVARINHTKCVYLKSAGKQVLNGTQATAYCRVRYTSGGDFTRAERQRTVMKQIIKKAKTSSIPTLYSVGNEMMPQIYTSLNSAKIMGLSALFPLYKIQEDTGFPFEKEAEMIHGASVVVPKTLSSNVTELHQYLFGTDNYTPTKNVQTYSAEIKARQ